MVILEFYATPHVPKPDKAKSPERGTSEDLKR